MSGGKLSIIPARAFDDPRLNHADLFVLGVIGIYADARTRETYVGEDTLASRCRMSARTIRYHLKRLQAFDLIERKRRFQRTAITRILFDKPATGLPVCESPNRQPERRPYRQPGCQTYRQPGCLS